jgi:hypothetical protein
MTYCDFADDNVRGRTAESSRGLCHDVLDSMIELLCRGEDENEVEASSNMLIYDEIKLLRR